MSYGSAFDGDIERIVRMVKNRLFEEILYELQTGGGIDFPGGLLSAEIQQQLDAIRVTVDKLKGLFKRAPMRVAEQLSCRDQRILDIGAGRAPWSVALAARAPGSRVTAVDLPEQIPALEAAVRAAGLETRFEIVTADVFGAGWTATGDHDLVVIANVCHLFSASRNRELLRRAVRRLRPGGTLVIIDQSLDEEPDWGRWSALYALGVLHCAPGGRLFPVRTYVEWLGELGSGEIAARSICPLPPLTLITARY